MQKGTTHQKETIETMKKFWTPEQRAKKSKEIKTMWAKYKSLNETLDAIIKEKIEKTQ